MSDVLKTLKVTLTGIRPLLCHNGQLVDPTNEFAANIKSLTKKKNKSDADHNEIGRIEWLGGWYRDAKGRAVIPAENIERFVQDGARKARLGKDVQAVVFCQESEVLIEHPDLNGNLEAKYGTPAFMFRRPAKVGTSRVMRVRPMVPTGWSLKFTLEYDSTVINERALQEAVLDAAALVGVGDWRPKFGRCTASFA